MGKMKPATPEEIKIIKDHFENRGYGVIRDETAIAQTDLLKMIRNGKYDKYRKECGGLRFHNLESKAKQPTEKNDGKV